MRDFHMRVDNIEIICALKWLGKHISREFADSAKPHRYTFQLLQFLKAINRCKKNVTQSLPPKQNHPSRSDVHRLPGWCVC